MDSLKDTLIWSKLVFCMCVVKAISVWGQISGGMSVQPECLVRYFISFYNCSSLKMFCFMLFLYYYCGHNWWNGMTIYSHKYCTVGKKGLQLLLCNWLVMEAENRIEEESKAGLFAMSRPYFVVCSIQTSFYTFVLHTHLSPLSPLPAFAFNWHD